MSISQELTQAPDLIELVAAARDSGQEVALVERPMPNAVSVAGVGRLYDIVAMPGGAALEDADGSRIDEELGPNPLVAAQRLWRRLAGRLTPTAPTLAIGGFAFNPFQEPRGPWAGFPALGFRIPKLAVVRTRGRTFASGDQSAFPSPHCGGGGAERRRGWHGTIASTQRRDGFVPPPPPLRGTSPASGAPAKPASWGGVVGGVSVFRAPAARNLKVEPERSPEDWMAAVSKAVHHLQAGDADKVVLAREMLVHADGALAAAEIARALRFTYPSCFTYLISGDDGTALVGASPELLVGRTGRRATSQPMAGSIARGRDEEEDLALAAQLQASAKDSAEHRVSAEQVAEALAPLAREVRRSGPEIIRFTNIQHLATTVEAELAEPPAGLLDLAAVLHPTPAVNGMPAVAATRLIAELEGMERGWYTGGVGWMDADGNGELAVAIRCGLLCSEGARLFAGNGMMPDSDPQAELQETELKLSVLLRALRSQLADK
jgi:isochorismate synthase